MDPPFTAGKSQQNYELSSRILLSAILLLFTVVLLMLALHLYVRWHVIRRASRRARRRRGLVFAVDDQTPPPCTVNRGLDPSILASFPVLLFSKYAGEGQEDELPECAVCLNEFKDGEKIRCLPRCSHRFHIDCIDMWLYSHSTCPLCRAAVEMVKNAATAINPGSRPAIDAVDAQVDSNGNELCPSCERAEEMGTFSPASGFRDVMIEIPASRAESSSVQEDQIRSGLELPEVQPLKSAGSRMVLIRWLQMGDPRIYWGGGSGSVPDLERGDGDSPPMTAAADSIR